MFGWAEERRSRREASKVFSLLTQRGELTCKTVKGGSTMRALINTGASVERYKNLRKKRLESSGWEAYDHKGDSETPSKGRIDKEFP